VQKLIDNEEPLVNDDALFIETLKNANIEKAKAVYIMTDNLEVQMVVNAHIRQLNKTCKLICRIFQDDIAEMIAKSYNAITISTSKFASRTIIEKIIQNNFKNILFIGLNHISSRVVNKIKKNSEINYHIIEEDEEIIEDLHINDYNIICGDPKDLTILEQVKIRDIDIVIITDPDVTSSILIIKRIREFNQKCKIIARFFLESIAEIIEKEPFKAEVISSSKDTLEIMINKGLLNL